MVDRAPVHPAGRSPRSLPASRICDAAERTNEEGDVIMETLGAGCVLDPTRSAPPPDLTTVAIEEALEDRHPNSYLIVQVRIRHELRGGPRASESKFAQGRGDGVGDDYAAAMAGSVMKMEVDTAACRRAGRAAVAEQETKRIGVQWHIAIWELDGGAEQWQLESVPIGGSEPTDHLPRLNNATGFSALPVLGCEDVPQMFIAAQSRRAVLRTQPKDRLMALRVHPKDWSRQAVRPDDEIANPEAADRPEAGWGEHGAGEGLGTAAHEGERRHLDHAALEVAVYPVGVEHVVERVEERTQVGVDLGLDVAGQESESLACLDGRAGEDDPLHLPLGQCRRSHRHSEEGLAGSGGADSEGDRMVADRVDVALLVESLRRHLGVAVLPDDVLEDLCRALVGIKRPSHRFDRARGYVVPLLDQLDQLVDDCGGCLYVGRVAVQGEHVAAQGEVAVHAAAQRPQNGVLRAGQLRRP